MCIKCAMERGIDFQHMLSGVCVCVCFRVIIGYSTLPWAPFNAMQSLLYIHSALALHYVANSTVVNKHGLRFFGRLIHWHHTHIKYNQAFAVKMLFEWKVPLYSTHKTNC